MMLQTKDISKTMFGGQDVDCQREKFALSQDSGFEHTKPVAHTDKCKYVSIWQHYIS